MCSGVGRELLLDALGETRLVQSWVSLALVARCGGWRDEFAKFGLADESAVPVDKLRVNGEDASNSSPFGRHVGDGETLVDREVLNTGSSELDGSVEDLILVEKTGQGDNNVLSRNTLGKLAIQRYGNHARNLPPELAGSPDATKTSA